MSTYDPYDTRDLSGDSGGGPMSSKTKLFIGGGAIGLVAIFLWYRKQKANATAVTDTSSTDTSSTDGSSLDTGYSPALTSYTDPSTGAIISGGGWSTGGYALPGTYYTAPSSNAQWVQQAIPYLSQQGFDPTATTIALGEYLAGQNLSNTQYEIVQAAIASEGYPPNPPAPPHVAPPSGQTGGTTSPVSSGVTHPAPPTGLHIVNKRKGSATLAWNASKGASEYAVFFHEVPIARTAHTTAVVHMNGHYSVGSMRGGFLSKRNGIDVKGI